MGRWFEAGEEVRHIDVPKECAVLVATAQPRDYFNDRRNLLRTVYEAATVVGSAKWPGKEEGRCKVYALWGINDPKKGSGYVEWILQISTCGIENYSESARLTRFPKNSIADFVDEKILQPETAGFVAMDEQALRALKSRDDMNPDYLRFFFGIKKA